MSALTHTQQIALAALPLILALTTTQGVRAYAADALGDRTPRMLGRRTLDPLKHVEPIGTVALPLITLWMGFPIGWPKALPVTVENLDRPRRALALIGLASFAGLLGLALVWALFARLVLAIGPDLGWMMQPLAIMGVMGVWVACFLFALNLLPVPGFGAGEVVASLLPPRLAYAYERNALMSFAVVVLLMVIGVLGKVLAPVARALADVVLSAFGLAGIV